MPMHYTTKVYIEGLHRRERDRERATDRQICIVRIHLVYNLNPCPIWHMMKICNSSFLGAYHNNNLNTSKVRESPVDVLEVDLSSPKGAAAVAGSKGIRIAKTTAVGIGESWVDIVLLGADLRCKVLRVAHIPYTEINKEIKNLESSYKRSLLFVDFH